MFTELIYWERNYYCYCYCYCCCCCEQYDSLV